MPSEAKAHSISLIQEINPTELSCPPTKYRNKSHPTGQTLPCVREVSDARRPSWKLAGGRLPRAWSSRVEDWVRGVPTGARVPGPAMQARRSSAGVDRPGLPMEDEDFKQLSEEAPSEGLTEDTTIPGGEEGEGKFRRLRKTGPILENIIHSVQCYLDQGCPTLYLEIYCPVGFHINSNLAYPIVLICNEISNC